MSFHMLLAWPALSPFRSQLVTSRKRHPLTAPPHLSNDTSIITILNSSFYNFTHLQLYVCLLCLLFISPPGAEPGIMELWSLCVEVGLFRKRNMKS